MLNIVLVEPEIPQNTGNIARTCAATGSQLHLVHPLGFTLDDRKMKRAGLDYWPMLHVREYENIDAFFEENKGERFWLSTTKAKKAYTQADFQPGDFLVFGRETAGLPQAVIARFEQQCIRIPMIEGARSLNLSNSVAVVTFEALRQIGFEGLQAMGPSRF